MSKYDDYDLKFYSPVQNDGDIVIDDLTGDFAITGQWECPRQDMTNRIRTQTTDWRNHPQIGGDLELLEGEPNTRETASAGSNQIEETLSYDGRFAPQDLLIRPVPTNIDQIDYYVFLKAGDQPIVVNQSLNL